MKIQLLACLGLTGVFVLGACSDRPTPEPVATPTDTSAVQAVMPRSPAPAGARVYFIAPTDGSTVSSPVRVEFGIEGMQLVAAGTAGENSGHHHLLVDTGLPDLGLPIPKDDQHIHYGDASTSAELTLAPGQHTLQLLLGDHLHIPHEPPVASSVITIIVE
ncbi:MAG: DUF4399 domain-containing protein [Gammaproteobacteria bacterium]|nr:DUF4399 domain-containing protein [Gammaproteobacteria bacterium]MDH5303172.1 DUF4399 domain-containing protein [Gammaproteobacteria bacterium]MDH5320820.1 DUF4399 domain-containing protein [Gammaproteobacteria bacterium]